MKTHDKDVFFKYTTASTALIVLRQMTLRWSSPALFNDPFDTQLEMQFGFELDEFVEPVLAAVTDLVFARDEPRWEMPPKVKAIVRMLRIVRDRLPRDEFLRQSREALAEGTRDVAQLLAAQRESWTAYVRTMRVLSVGEEHDNVLMWSHYADHHKGVVIALKCLPERDTALCAARQMRYSDEIPVLASLDDYVRHTTGERRLPFDNVFFDLTFTKSAHWAYEREWRCWSVAPPTEDQQTLWDDIELISEEVESVYLGCRIDGDQRDAILTLLKPLAHVKVLQARMERGRFALAFDQLR